MLSELNRIESQLRFMQEGPAWHGKSVAEALKDLDHQAAAKVPFSGAHSIWALVLHIISWRTYAIEMIKKNEEFHIEINSAVDWPPIGEVSEKNWTESVARLAESNRELRDHLLLQQELLLDEKVPHKPFSYYVLLQGIAQHDAYHCGQIVLTRHWLSQLSTLQ